MDPMMSSLVFLNEVASRFPDSISFAAGRPAEDYFDTADIARYIEIFTNHLREQREMSEAEVRRTLLQYGRTNGIIHDLVARQLEIDEGVRVPAESIVITVGAQEGIFLVLRALRGTQRDAVLAVAPTYAGLAGAARLVDCPVVPVRSGDGGIDLADLQSTIDATRRRGLRPRLLYIVPDVSNPTGISLDLSTRRRLLEIVRTADLFVLEDNAYGVFAGGGRRLPTLKSLDEQRRVIRVGSFAKTVWPGARVGYVVADQLVGERAAGAGPARATLLAEQLGVIKSMLTVNTSPITQAVVGGALIAHGISLFAANERQIAIYQRNLALMLDGLGRRLSGTPGVSWNSPTGGFFLSLGVPFRADEALLEWSAREHGVLWTPMSNFYTDGGGANHLRLAFSQMDPPTIDEGLDRLAGFIRAAAASSKGPESSGTS
ncbi:PLP-dependent aminotransferase family protein [Streptomyces sp. ISL-21]|nr:PLP-dependent aminotransferase family protein [Streptomyces sp. ISL-21]MBT2408574.1 PLP-dependent aminotransferase family protein [Streptomyces sp. ISL-21]MBT2608742.1 PLP-dependent aminotransferase family protein [Streptomyces sp. ISL-87]